MAYACEDDEFWHPRTKMTVKFHEFPTALAAMTQQNIMTSNSGGGMMSRHDK